MRTSSIIATLSLVAIVGGGGYWAGKNDVGAFLQPYIGGAGMGAEAEPRREGTGPVIYYRNPDGAAEYSAKPADTDDGRPFTPVRASEDISFGATGAVAPAVDTASITPDRKVLYYRNPMGLSDTSKSPKKDSMGMDYIPVYDGEADGGSAVRVPLGKLQRTGVRTAEVTMERLPTSLHVPGIVMLDDRRIHSVSMRSDSFIEVVAPVTTGSRVKAGDSLFRFYSKEVATAASEYANVVSGGGDTAGSALRLRNLGMSDRAIEAVRRDRKVPPSMSFDAPADGIVIERATTSGSMAEPGDILFRIADTREMWIVADVPESQLGAVAVGATAAVTVSARPGMALSGVVELVDPEIRDQTRTAKVRILIPNPDGTLLPNMFATVEISSGQPAPVVSVPNDAIIDTGNKRVVFVDKGDGRFEPRDIEVGVRAPQRTEVTAGLTAGERVVVSANFLIDAESNLNSALSALAAGDVQP
ncbi:efflux RND transporter periplasmic adaptor subunit [Agrobacterium vitis]|uniref:efflux RND transporter periplasmic adaptor subunit n=1 Tax=Agrobacterium vitis TaxID=373 RepID=UPI002E35B596|nr:efflux RND transporter periplasmic adaptor subunit [Agrobacterium vitis]MCE6077487.1 efflux RND transporter periplasmic adaptor subunit [Agrobacterium vitis]